MKWVVLAILVFIVAYTYLTLHFRRPGKAFEPYRDMRDRADVIRLLKAGYERIPVDASRPVDLPAIKAGPTAAAPGGLPAELRATLIEHPLLPQEVTAVTAAATAVSGIDYPVELTYTLSDNRRQLSGAHVYVRAGELVIVPDFEALAGSLLARERTGTALLDLPPTALKPGTYRVTLVGELSSRTWTLAVR
jgi:hypothetical protein